MIENPNKKGYEKPVTNIELNNNNNKKTNYFEMFNNHNMADIIRNYSLITISALMAIGFMYSTYKIGFPNDYIKNYKKNMIVENKETEYKNIEKKINDLQTELNNLKNK